MNRSSLPRRQLVPAVPDYGFPVTLVGHPVVTPVSVGVVRSSKSEIAQEGVNAVLGQ